MRWEEMLKSIIEMKDFFEEKPRKINKKKIVILSITAILIITCLVLAIIYAKNEQFRNWMDENVLRKNINRENLPTIEIKEDENKVTIKAQPETSDIEYNEETRQVSKINFHVINNSAYSNALLSGLNVEIIRQ